MTDDQAAELLETLDRIASALEELGELGMSRNTFQNTKLGDRPQLIDCIAIIADGLAK